MMRGIEQGQRVFGFGFSETWQFTSESLAGEHQEVLDDGTEGEGGEELQAADDEDDADQQADEQRRRRSGRCRREAARLLLGGDGAGHGHYRDDIAEAAHASWRCAVVMFHQGVLALRPAKAEPLLPVADV